MDKSSTFGNLETRIGLLCNSLIHVLLLKGNIQQQTILFPSAQPSQACCVNLHLPDVIEAPLSNSIRPAIATSSEFHSAVCVPLWCTPVGGLIQQQQDEEIPSFKSWGNRSSRQPEEINTVYSWIHYLPFCNSSFHQVSATPCCTVALLFSRLKTAVLLY